jgi:glycosyltransferase involved in cell wall biosynthesis
MRSPVVLNSISICIITFKRPNSLRRTLDGLAKLEVPDDLECRVIVVDNEAQGYVIDAVAELSALIPFPLTAVEEPVRGIPFARNRAVVEAGGSDAIVWLDDDEVPRFDWLVALVEAQRRVSADIVQGPSEPVFEGEVPQWVLDGGFFERRKVSHLSAVGRPWLRTSGVLVLSEVFTVSSPPFNESMRFTGGTDTLFFGQAIAAGFSAVWAADAVVDEYVPASRANVRWLLRRSYRVGCVRSQLLVDSGATVPRRLKRAVTGVQELSRMFPALVRARTAGKAGLVRSAQPIAQACGTWSGLVGRTSDEYRETHGH